MSTFREKVRFARLWGAIVLMVGAFGTLGMKLTFDRTGQRPTDLFVLIVSGLPIALGAVMLLFGGVVRPLQRSMYFYALKDSELLMFGTSPRERVPSGLTLRFGAGGSTSTVKAMT